MKSKKNLMLLAALSVCFIMTNVSMAETINAPADGSYIIRVVREDGAPLATYVSVDGAPDVLVDGEEAFFLTAGDHDVVLTGIDPDLVTYDEIYSEDDPPELIGYEFIVEPVEAKIKMSPRSLNVDSKGNWINCKIQLPRDYPVEDIQTGTVVVTVEGEVEVDGEMEPYLIEDIRTSRVQVMKRFIMVKIKRSDITDPLKEIGANGTAEVTVVGELETGLYFKGTQTLKIINQNT